MDAVTRILFLDENREKFFGEGPYRLLIALEETGSLHKAALSMGMAYSKAMKILKHAEQVLGYPLTDRTVGGASGGGSRLTPRGKAWLEKYAAYRDACVEANRRLYLEYFPESGSDNSSGSDVCAPREQLPTDAAVGNTGCVIMASGQGRRFGGNKLMADFGGKPMIAGVLAATACIPNRVVVTRHGDVAAYCRDRGITAVLHDLPNRNDTVRLGLEALPNVDRCIFCPGDQPLLTEQTVMALVHLSSTYPDCILRPSVEGRPGAPILFPKAFFSELKTLPQGKGGSYIAKKYPEQVICLPIRDIKELMDVDTPDDLQALRDL